MTIYNASDFGFSIAGQLPGDGGSDFDYSVEKPRACPCGSGHDSWWARDARGIEIARVCEACEEAKLARYRPDVLTDADYWADEPIEPDDY